MCTQLHHNHGISCIPTSLPIGLTTRREGRKQSPSPSFMHYTPSSTEDDHDACGFPLQHPTVRAIPSTWSIQIHTTSFCTY